MIIIQYKNIFIIAFKRWEKKLECLVIFKKRKIYHQKNLVLLEDVDTDNTLIPGIVSSGEN